MNYGQLTENEREVRTPGAPAWNSKQGIGSLVRTTSLLFPQKTCVAWDSKQERKNFLRSGLRSVESLAIRQSPMVQQGRLGAISPGHNAGLLLTVLNKSPYTKHVHDANYC